jgi:cytochrome c oxidase cbb3-type subunit 3
MKFQNYLENIAGIGIYPMFSLIVFFIFFVVLIWRVSTMDKQSIKEISNIPLEDNTTDQAENLNSDWKNKHQLN